MDIQKQGIIDQVCVSLKSGRKLKEILLSIKLDRELPKDTILQIYLNESPYGGTMYGVEEASLTYFNKHAKDVTLTEAAYLAALPQSPASLPPQRAQPVTDGLNR